MPASFPSTINFIFDGDANGSPTVLREIEDTFSMVVLFRNRNGEQTGDYSILTAEFSKEEWAGIRACTVLQNRPLWLRIPGQKIILMER